MINLSPGSAVIPMSAEQSAIRVERRDSRFHDEIGVVVVVTRGSG